MLRRQLRSCLVGIALITGGCAWSTHKEVEDHAAADGGIFYYGVSPYLLVYSDGKGSIVTELQYLPDQSKLMKATFFNFLASHDSTLELEHGALAKGTSKADGALVPKAIIAAAEKVLPALLAASDATEKEKRGHEVPPPHLYKVVVDDAKICFLGGDGKEPIRVTLVEDEPKQEAKP